jgi:membrane protein DedA with SNARE-associated domain/rhodanese-related sulfurtransferase
MAAPFGVGALFLNVLLQQLGVPIPAVPTLIVAGALAADGRLPGKLVCALAIAACLIGDSSWYLAGRRYGSRVMKLLCRISLTPDVCVNETQASFERFGPAALVVAKFVPGLSLVAPPLAGATRMSFLRFVLFDFLGGALWVGTALAAGLLLHRQIERLLPRLSGIGATAILLLAALLFVYVACKWWERRRFYAARDMRRVGVAELHEQLNSEVVPLVVDVRSATAQSLEPRRIPGALHLPLAHIERELAHLPRDREIVFYCSCPNEASAAEAARLLQNRGFLRVWPLQGGLEAWLAAGYASEPLAVSGAPERPAPSAAAAGGRG